MRIRVLGAAAGGGFPQWNCNCGNCRLCWAGSAALRPHTLRTQTQSSLAVSADGARWYLFNASPDLRQQIIENPPLQPKSGLRDSGLAGAVLTNGDVDHVAGLLNLRESQPLALYASARILDVLAANPIFNVLNPEFVERRPIRLGERFALCDRAGRESGIVLEVFPVPGKVALYLENPDAGADFGTQAEDTVGLHVQGPGGEFFYVPGCAAMSDDLAARLRGAPLVFFDGTLWRDDEMVAAGVGVKTGRRMGHMSMSGEDGSIAAFRDLGVGRRIFVHINNTNPVLLPDSAERAEAEAAGWEIAYDGMEIAL